MLGWRDVPTVADPLGPDRAQRACRGSASCSSRAQPGEHGLELERRAFALRKVAERRAREAQLELYFPSLSARTLVYKGMLTTDQLGVVFPDLTDGVRERHRARAQPVLDEHLPVLAAGPPVPLHRAQRRDQHDPRQPQLDAHPRDAARVRPDPGRPQAAVPDLHARTASDSASFDEVLELLHMGGRSLPHAVLMMIPEAWENNTGHGPAPAARSTSSTRA